MRYLTKEWYLAGQTWPVAADVQARLDETGRAFREARTFSIDSPFSGYHTVIFRHARVKQALPPAGAVWLYEELYRHKSGTGYEAHILLEAPTRSGRRRLQLADLFDLKLICSEICFA